MPLIVFDLDGTLVDSRRDLADSTNDVLIRAGGHPLPVDVVASMVGDGARALIERAVARAGVDLPVDQALAWFRAAYDRRLVATTRPYPGLPAVIERLAERAALAVLTNKPEGPARGLLGALDLARHFRVVIGGDSPHGRKPDPAGLLAMIEQTGATPADTMLVGDSPIDVETARRAGVAMCVARYGFGAPDGHFALTGSELQADDAETLGRLLDAWLDARAAAAGTVGG